MTGAKALHVKHFGHFLSILTLAGLNACAAQETMLYTPRVLEHTLTRAQVERALLAHAADAGWDLVHRSADALEAVTPVTSLEGTPIRERWRFAYGADHLIVERRFEASFDGSTWQGADDVCDTYVYLAEDALAAALRRRFDAIANVMIAKTARLESRP